MLYVLIILLVSASILLAVYAIRTSKQKRHQERLEIIQRNIPEVAPAFKDISSFYSYGHYITESERIRLDEKYADLLSEVNKVIGSEELERHPEKDTIERFQMAMSDSKGFKKVNNEEFVKKQLKECSHPIYSRLRSEERTSYVLAQFSECHGRMFCPEENKGVFILALEKGCSENSFILSSIDLKAGFAIQEDADLTPFGGIVPKTRYIAN